jgi:predicted DNA-binding transcriptional regulator AlpA
MSEGDASTGWCLEGTQRGWSTAGRVIPLEKSPVHAYTWDTLLRRQWTLSITTGRRQKTMKLMTRVEVAQLFGMQPATIDKRFRQRVGLRAIKVGKAVLFDPADVQAVLDRSREPLPSRPQNASPSR